MSGHLSWLKQWTVITLTSMLSISSLLATAEVWAGNANNNNRQGWPTRRVGGGSRGCGLENGENTVQNCRPLVALVPEGLALTTQTAPSLWFYIPQVKNPEHTLIELVIRDENDRLIYETTFKATDRTGISSFQLPESASFGGLEEGKVYHWYLSLIYQAQDRAHDDVVEGWVQRVPLAPSLAQQLQQATPLEKVSLYQNADLWPEAIAAMASLKQVQPDDPTVSQAWQQLITSLALPFGAANLLDSQQKNFSTANR